ncbi:hypothetical protein K2173_013560 [Erythroxylum novogranatense]|uniref:DUF4283 domain-containing protein n=1 Tax=Erythroxylum novogranatense TaxID=1862640 RepID=A0AAV8TML6_9ROSI|nr:hypothetical protein K2173_013560 [Erythroxylum novogranatense]
MLNIRYLTGRATESNRELSTEEADQINRSIKRAKKIEVRRHQSYTMMEEDARYEGQQESHELGADMNARGINYREVLMGCDNQDGEVKTPMATMEEDIRMIDFSNSLCPKILFSDAELEAFCQTWRCAIIIKVMGRTVGYVTLRRRLLQIWNPKGELELIDLPNDYFIVKFSNKEDRDFAMFEGPWMVQGHCLLVQEWTPAFHPLEAKVSKVAAWIRIPHLPMEFQTVAALRRIGYGVGRTLRIDKQTAASSRGNFARLCVELDLIGSEEKLAGGDGGPVVQGEGGKPMETAVCVDKAGALVPPADDSVLRNQAPENNLPAFGPWMIVNGKSNRFRNSAKIKGSATTKSGEPKALSSRRGSRFGILDVEEIADSGTESKEMGIMPANLATAVKSGWNQASRAPQDGPQYVGRKETDERSAPKVRLVGHGKDQVSGNIIGTTKAGSLAPEQPHAMIVEWIETVDNEKVTESDELRRLGNAQGEEHARSSQSVPCFQAGETSENPIPITDWDPGSSLQQTRNDLLGTTGREVVTTIPMAAPMDFVPETQGAAAPIFRRTLREYIREHRPDIVIILEPRISGVEADRRIEAQGFSGGIWVWWKHNVLTLSSFSSFGQAMLFKVALESGKEVWLTAEKVGGAPVDPARCLRFREIIDECKLIDLGSVGPRMTWKGPKVGTYNRVFKRLDRALCNADWLREYNETTVRVLPRVGSDHHPLLVDIQEETRKTSYGRPFRYQAIWQRHPKFVDFLKTTWPQHVGLGMGLHIM